MIPLQTKVCSFQGGKTMIGGGDFGTFLAVGVTMFL